MVARTDERAGGRQSLAHLRKLVERRNLPGDVVHPDCLAPRGGRCRAGTDREERDVVVVRRGRSAHEHEAALHRGDGPPAYRRIHEFHAARAQLPGDVTRCRRITRSAVKQDRSLPHAVEHPVVSVQYGFDLR